MTTSPATRVPARDRLLAAASELFYAEGIHVVGIDRIIEHAGVAKASLYNTFGSKEELVQAYLRDKAGQILTRYRAAIEAVDSPREKILAVFESQGSRSAEAGYHGCPFLNASGEPDDSADNPAVRDFRQAIRGLFLELAVQAGAADPPALAQQLHMVYDGASINAHLDSNRSSGPMACATAAALIDAATT